MLALAICLPTTAKAQSFDTHVDDLALIWIGGLHRPDWNKERFKAYLGHTFADGHKSWFFDGFLMLDGAVHDPNNPSKVYSLGEAPGDFASQEQWEWLLDHQLGLDNGFGCTALNEAIEELLPVLGKPSYRHQVVLMVPIPPIGLSQWGKFDGYPLSFTRNEDRIKAQKWYVDLAIKKWKQCNFKNLELAGFYWLRESIDPQEIPVAKGFNEYCHSIDMNTYWIPWYGAPLTENWKEYGFTQTYIQPGYVFSLDKPISRLEGACINALTFECGLEMEFEGWCTIGYDAASGDTRVDQPQGNSCRWADAETCPYAPQFYNRFVEYINYFEDYGAFDVMPLAYYNGYQAIYDFSLSTHPKDIEILDRLAGLLEYRHTFSNWSKPVGAGIDDVLNQQTSTIYGVEGGIYVADKINSPVEVYTVDGRQIYKGLATDTSADFHYGKTITCPSGFYIVKTSSRTVKVHVK